MKTILYLCYGDGPQIDETRFSLMSAFRFGSPETCDHQFVVYTENPGQFAGLGVKIVELDAATLDAWLGRDGYAHRRKTMTIVNAMRRFPGSVVFVDCDTYFLKPPAALFSKLGHGRTRLHILEGRLIESRNAANRMLSEIVAAHTFFDLNGREFTICPDAAMWNSGVLGIDSRDARLMDETLNLIDQMWPLVKNAPVAIHHVEQFATGYFFGTSQISESHDIVYHYWPESVRLPFRKRLPALLAIAADASPAERGKLIFCERPRTDYLWKLKIGMRTGLRRLGLRVPGIRCSA
jgi:hypothetical protein